MSGFPNKVVALQFEWQWQNADKSRVMKKRKSIEKSRRRGYQVSLKVLHSLLDSQLWKRLGLRVHFLDKDVMRVFSAHFTSGGAGSSAEGAGHGSTEANAVLNTPAEFDALHENRDAGDKGLCPTLSRLQSCPSSVRSY